MNWGRRDGIRAGAVSGPWRSAPRETAAPPRPVADLERSLEVAPATRRRPQRSISLAVWVALGGGVAVMIVAAAYLLRPDQAEAPVAPATVAVEPEPLAAAVGQQPAPDPALAAVSSVRLRAPDDLPAERLDAIVAALEAGGIGDVRVEALAFAVQTSRVGYYLEADRPAAEALARLASASTSAGTSLPVRDYSKLLDDPEPGRLDLWVRN